ncbi:MAG TPA: hypothetical protein VN306_15325, partial [Mycobacterium sp.]|nr:hypothetical protein [Mycobacterium sp.]
MADRLDVAERLAEGRPAVEHTQSYVQACHVLGYGHPDLTSHPSQIRDWYDSEDGLDLRALDRDCAELRAAGAAVLEALRTQRDQIAELAAAWTGPGGDSAVRFLQGHVDAGYTVATEVRAAAQRCESLRDNLWYLVDSKVATAIAIDDRTQAQRETWLAAAAAVTTGVGDRPTAEEVVRQEVIPYLDNEIRNDWLTTMRSTEAGVATSYDMVTDRMAAAPVASFEFPGDLGPGYRPFPPAPPSDPTSAAAVAPAPQFPSLPADPPPAPTLTAAAPLPAATTPATPVPDLGNALGDASAMPAGDLGGGLSGLGGLASRIVDAMGSLLGSAADQLGAGDADTEDPFNDEDPFHADDKHDDSDDARDPESDEPDEAKEVDDTEEVKPGQEARPVDAPPPVEAPAPVGAPPAVEGPPPPVDAPTPPAPPLTGGPA